MQPVTQTYYIYGQKHFTYWDHYGCSSPLLDILKSIRTLRQYGANRDFTFSFGQDVSAILLHHPDMIDMLKTYGGVIGTIERLCDVKFIQMGASFPRMARVCGIDDYNKEWCIEMNDIFTPQDNKDVWKLDE